jgi:hypothetical protein
VKLFTRRAAEAPTPSDDLRSLPAPPDLRGYAQSRGLDFRGALMQAGYESVMLGRDENEHNVMRGTLPGGEHGVLFHELASFDLDGDGYPLTLPRPQVESSLGDHLEELNHWLMFDPAGIVGRVKSRPPVRAAFTTAAVPVPEATAVMPRLRVDRSPVFPPYDFTFGGPLDSLGLTGWHAKAEPQLDQALFERFADADVRRVLDLWAADPYPTHVVFWHGMLAVRRFGFEGDPGRLDAIVSAAAGLAARLRAAALQGRATAPFSVSLPPPQQGPFAPPGLWEHVVAKLAGRLGLEREDPLELHRAFPSLPVPGQAFAVLRGELPGAGPGRVVLATGRPLEGWNIGRNAVLLPVRPGLAPTPPGGVAEQELKLRWHVAGDYAAFHAYRTGTGAADAGDVDGLIERAARVARERGLLA